MTRILVINPNASDACSAGISRAIEPLRFPGGPALDVTTLREGPPAIYTWRDWHSVVEPMCRLVEQETADAYVIACASDPGIEAVRSATAKPVFGIFRSAVAAAVARAERFGIIALVDSSVARHAAALRAMGLEHRLAAEIPMNISMETLLDAAQARQALIQTGANLKRAGAQSIILGCTGMAHHRDAIQHETGLPVIEPAQAAVALATAAVLAG